MKSKRLLEILAAANEFKEGDISVGGTRDEKMRFAARQELSATRIGKINASELVEDGISDVFTEYLDTDLAQEIAHFSVVEVKDILLGSDGARFAKNYHRGLKSETIAAIVKVMTNAELGIVARSIYNPLPGKGIAIGSRCHFGSRIQPNSAGDNEEEILFSIFEGLSYGCGDVMIGLNPASDDVETILRLENLLAGVIKRLQLPTRWCVLSDILKQADARGRGAKVDVGFQSLAGTSKALAGYVGLGVKELHDISRGFDGLYFETGQGSEVTNGAAEGVDMVTLESRCYGVARYLQQRSGVWTIVNDVAGFIGPEVFRTEDQLFRACLEDTVMAKLHGLTFGLDVCATFHMGIHPQRLRTLTEKIVRDAAPAYLMSVAGNADPMLGYLTTSPREHARIRLERNRHVTSEMQERLTPLGILGACGLPKATPETVLRLYAKYKKEGGDTREFHELHAEAKRKISALQSQNFDIGVGCPVRYVTPLKMEKRVDDIYENAQKALVAVLDPAVLRDVSPKYLRVSTLSVSRDEYVNYPQTGNTLRLLHTLFVRGCYWRFPEVQLVISDGLNANAVNENLRDVLPGVCRGLTDAGFNVGKTDIFITNGRVRAGYDIGRILEVPVIIHFIGERPGTGLNTLSAYITYGKDLHEKWRFHSDMAHSCTTAVCGIHKRGKHPDAAIEEIVAIVKLMFEKKCSGVELNAK